MAEYSTPTAIFPTSTVIFVPVELKYLRRDQCGICWKDVTADSRSVGYAAHLSIPSPITPSTLYDIRFAEV